MSWSVIALILDRIKTNKVNKNLSGQKSMKSLFIQILV